MHNEMKVQGNIRYCLMHIAHLGNSELEMVSLVTLDVVFVCRSTVEQRVHEAQQRFRRKTCDTEEGREACKAITQDDIFRAYGVLLALNRYTDKVILFSKLLLRDKFMLKRAPRRMLWRNAAYL